MILNLNSESVEDTRTIGEKLGYLLEGTELILISGDLGSGKTVFTKGVAKALGIDEKEIVSPTFTLQNRYYSEVTKTYLFHFDMYRIGNDSSSSFGLISPEIDEELSENIIIVEWAQYLHKSYFTVPNSIKIHIIQDEENLYKRKLKIETNIKSIATGL